MLNKNKKEHHHHHHHHDEDPTAIAARAREKLMRQKHETEEHHLHQHDVDYIPGLPALPMNSRRHVEDEKSAGEEKEQDTRLTNQNSKSRVSFDPRVLNTEPSSSSLKRANSPKQLSAEQLSQLPSLDAETKRWMTQGFTKDQAEKAAKKVIDEKRRGFMMENQHNSLVRNLSKDIYRLYYVISN